LANALVLEFLGQMGRVQVNPLLPGLLIPFANLNKESHPEEIISSSLNWIT